MKSYPRARATGGSVREVVARVLLEDVKDPRVDLVTVTGVDVSRDLRHANVYVIAHGDEERYREALAGLESAKGLIKRELAGSLRMKYVPDLHFKIDPSVDGAIRIAEVLQREHAAADAKEMGVGDAPAPPGETAADDE